MHVMNVSLRLARAAAVAWAAVSAQERAKDSSWHFAWHAAVRRGVEQCRRTSRDGTSS